MFRFCPLLDARQSFSSHSRARKPSFRVLVIHQIGAAVKVVAYAPARVSTGQRRIASVRLLFYVREYADLTTGRCQATMQMAARILDDESHPLTVSQFTDAVLVLPPLATLSGRPGGKNMA